MPENRPDEYAAFLCRKAEDGEFVPFEETTVGASNDQDAKHNAAQWIVSVRDMIDDETWLVVKHGARCVHLEKLRR